MEAIKINNTILEFNKIIYVDAINGSDEVGDGSKNNPYRTLQIAINNSNKGNAIKLAEGVYSIYSILNMISVDSLNFIGENINTIIEVQNSSNIAMPEHSSNFYNLVIKPSDAFSGDQRSIFYSNGSSGRYILRFYNIVFAKSSNNLYPTAYWFIWHQNTKANRDVVFNNCSFEKVSTEVALYEGTQQRYINCAFENSNWNTGTKEYCLYNINLDSDYSILDEGWQNTGTGLNPNGTQAHIGVYGGEFAWGNWKSLLKSNNKYYTYQNNEFIEVEPTVENFKEKSINLSLLATPTDKVVLTMEGGYELEDGKIYRKTINTNKYKRIIRGNIK